MTIHLRQDQIPGDAELRRIAPGRVADQVMHRLVAGPDAPRVDPRRHGLDALAVSRQTETGEVDAQRLTPIRMSEGTRQPVEVLTESSFPGIGRVWVALLRSWQSWNLEIVPISPSSWGGKSLSWGK